MSSIPVRYDDPWLEDVEAEGREAQWVESVLEGLAEQGYTRGEEVALTPRLVQSVLRLWDNTVLGGEEDLGHGVLRITFSSKKTQAVGPELRFLRAPARF